MKLADPRLQIRILLLLSLAGLSAVLMAVTGLMSFTRLSISTRETAESVSAHIAEQNTTTSLLNDLQTNVVRVISANDELSLEEARQDLAELRSKPAVSSFGERYLVNLGELIADKELSFQRRSEARQSWRDLKSDLHEVNRVLAETVDTVEFESLSTLDRGVRGSSPHVTADELDTMYESVDIARASWRIQSTLDSIEATVQGALLADSPALLDMAEAEATTVRQILEREFEQLTRKLKGDELQQVQDREAQLYQTVTHLESFLSLERAARKAEQDVAQHARELTDDLVAWHVGLTQLEADATARATARLQETYASVLRSRNLLVVVAGILILITFTISHTVFRAIGRYVQLRQEAERQLAQRNLTIERASRKLEEHADQLRDMALEAQAASMAKSQFVANMSHEIRTPLNGIIGMVDLLNESPLNEEQKDFMATIRQSSDALLTTINDILDFSKIEAGKVDLERILFEPRAVLESVADILAPRAHAKHLEFVVSTAPNVPVALLGDPGRLRQIITNLAGNAVKFTHAGHIHVRCSIASANEEHEQSDADESPNALELLFEVTDTGIGLTPAQQELIFSPFTQADTTTTREFGGTGLGLAISKQLVEAMQGELRVSSESGQGACFWFTAAFAIPADLADSPLSAKPWFSLQGRRALVVSESAASAEAIGEYLSSWSMVSLVCSSDVEAREVVVSRINESPVDVVIIDSKANGLDGVAMSKGWEGEPELCAIPRVVITPDNSPLDLTDTGLIAHMAKPIKQSRLLEVLLSIFGIDGDAVVGDVPAATTNSAVAIAKTWRILLVDDVVINQRVAMKMLGRLGLTCDTAINGREAVDMHLQSPYDLILMDCQMPVMDGFDATRIIRRREDERQHVVIVAMTAMALHTDREECLAAGMDDYITKPVTIRALESLLERFETSVRARRAAMELNQPK